MNFVDYQHRIRDIKLSVFEIYKEKIFDLLQTETQPMSIEQKLKNINPQTKQKFNEIFYKHSKLDARQKKISNLAEIMEALQLSESLRTVDDNGINFKSSRSHTVYRITFKHVKSKNTDQAGFGSGNVFNQPAAQDNQEGPLQNIFTKEGQNKTDFPNFAEMKEKFVEKEIYVIDLAGAEKPSLNQNNLNNQTGAARTRTNRSKSQNKKHTNLVIDKIQNEKKFNSKFRAKDDWKPKSKVKIQGTKSLGKSTLLMSDKMSQKMKILQQFDMRGNIL